MRNSRSKGARFIGRWAKTPKLIATLSHHHKIAGLLPLPSPEGGYLLEDNSGFIVLEDASGFLVLE